MGAQNRLTEAVLTCTHNLYVLSKNKKIIKFFHLKISIFTAMKNRCILHGHVFVMFSSKYEGRLINLRNSPLIYSFVHQIT